MTQEDINSQLIDRINGLQKVVSEVIVAANDIAIQLRDHIEKHEYE